MKKVIQVILLTTIFSNVLLGQKIIEYPKVEANACFSIIQIKNITIDDRHTVVAFRFQNNNNWTWMNTYRPGHKYAYYIQDSNGKRIANLIRSENIPFKPNKLKLYGFGQVVDYRFVFETIDRNLSEINIVSDNEKQCLYYGVNLGNSESANKVSSTGTGFALHIDGYIATNQHVIQDAKSIEVVFNHNDISKAFICNVIKTDKRNDIAILKIVDEGFTKFENIPYSISADYEIGESVFTIGFPQPDIMGTESKLTTGIINATSGIDNDNTCLQISAQIQPGNSGGALFNQNGDVIGITSSSLNSVYIMKHKGNLPQNVNYAIKSDYLSALTKDLYQSVESKTLLPVELKDKYKVIKSFICQVNVSR